MFQFIKTFRKELLLWIYLCILFECLFGKGVLARQTQKISSPSLWASQRCHYWIDPLNGNRVDYCIKSVSDRLRYKKTAYVFHGMNQEIQKICDPISMSLEKLHALGNAEQNISHLVCLSFGPCALVHESGRTDSFQRFHTYLQKQYSINTTFKAVLYGESMGGFNALKLSGIKKNWFQKVAVGCPAIFSIRLPSRWMTKHLPKSLFGHYDYDASTTMIHDSPYFDSVSYPEIFMVSNLQDPLGVIRLRIGSWVFGAFGGIYRGARNFYERMHKRFQEITLREVPGAHCVGIPLQEVSRFLNSGLEEFSE